MTPEDIRKIPGTRVLTEKETRQFLIEKVFELDRRVREMEHIIVNFCVCGKLKI